MASLINLNLEMAACGSPRFFHTFEPRCYFVALARGVRLPRQDHIARNGDTARLETCSTSSGRNCIPCIRLHAHARLPPAFVRRPADDQGDSTCRRYRLDFGQHAH